MVEDISYTFKEFLIRAVMADSDVTLRVFKDGNQISFEASYILDLDTEYTEPRELIRFIVAGDKLENITGQNIYG